ncbi:hypothetical protein GCM10027271_60020 [Saccharopolyspora gloriosae]|uniref:FtsH-binding integral membrane protein n=1 Tax=Saccharopolyspora gloriosae TaxID=455344 RepID=A0A840N8X5_9PSEU|nr:FtsH-binding integral membrane protein [Saccharopolyspora gloriosae]
MSALFAPTIMAAMIVAVIWAAKRAASRRRSAARRRGRRPAVLLVGALVAIQALIGAPVSAQGLDCKEPPSPERPQSGMVGAIDRAPLGTGVPGSPYDEFGYAGHVWHNYDLGCGPQGMMNPNALVDTWLGNELFNVSKNLVGATNGLHYALVNGNLMGPLDDLIATGTVALYDSVFTPWFGVAALVLAVLLFRYIWQGDLATIGKRTMWALAGLWFASATYLTPMIYTHALDEVVITGTSVVQSGFLQQVGVGDATNSLPTELHEQVVYNNWLRGEFGAPDAPEAERFGPQLLRAQAWTKQEVEANADKGPATPKTDAFTDVASQLQSTSAYGYFQGKDGSRVGAAMLSLVQGLAFASFQLMAKAAILLAQVLLRVLILAGPLIGLVALLNHQVLRAVGRIAGAAMLNVLVIAAMAGLHTWVLMWIFNGPTPFDVLLQILLAGLVTIVFIMIGKPVHRMGQMVQLSVGGNGGVAQASRGVFGRFRGRRPADDPSGDFWEQVRESDPDAPPPDPAGQRGRWQTRPEADHQAMSATAQRLDRQGGPWAALPGSGAPTGGGMGSPALPASGPAGERRPGGPAAALPEGRASRVVDTAPVSDVAWDRREEEPVLVPSLSEQAPMPAPAEATAPRRADMEVVAGKPVYVVYRPSRGLEVADED